MATSHPLNEVKSSKKFSASCFSGIVSNINNINQYDSTHSDSRAWNLDGGETRVRVRVPSPRLFFSSPIFCLPSTI